METTLPITLPSPSPVTTDAVDRVRHAQTFLPRLRDLRELRDVLERQPVFVGIADRMAEIEEEIAVTEASIVQALTSDFS